MNPKPVIFLSAVSRELKTARQLVANTLLSLGYDPDWQDIFGAEQGDLRAMLRRRIDASDGVVQLIGQRYGAEPPVADEPFGRVSYTQYEALYARQQDKKVWYLFLDEAFPRDTDEPEPEELRALQAAYRQRVRTGNDLYQPINTSEGLENHVLKLRDDLAHLRRRGKLFMSVVLATLGLLASGVSALIHGQKKQDAQIRQVTEQNTKLLQAMRDLPQTLSRTAQVGAQEDEATRLARAYATLEEKHQLPAGTLERELPRFAAQLLARPDTSALDRANALFVTKKFAEAEAAALVAKDQALAAAGKPVQDAIDALAVAGNAAWRQIQYARALDHFRAAAALTDRQRDPVEWASRQWNIANVLHDQGQYAEAGKIWPLALEEYRRAYGEDDADVLTMRNNLANALGAQGQHAEAEQEHRARIAIEERVLGAEHPNTLRSRNNLANALNAQGKYAEAEQKHRARIAIEERVLGAEHPQTLMSRNNLADALRAQGKASEAEQEHRARIAIEDRVFGVEHPQTLMSRMNLAVALWAQGKASEAEQEHRAVLEIKKRVLGAEHPETLKSQNNLALALWAQGKHGEAEQEQRAVLASQKRVLGAEHPDTLMSWMNVANALFVRGKVGEAEQEHRAVWETKKRVLGAEHPETLASQMNLASALAMQRKHAEAEQEFRAVLALQERVLGAEHPDIFQSCSNLALVLQAQGKYAEALTVAQQAECGWRKAFGEGHPDSKGAKTFCEEIEREMEKRKRKE